MKQINNACVEVLPSLLDRTKVQTIRKGWEEKTLWNIDKKEYYQMDRINLPPKYKVGDEVEMVWNFDSESHKFCCKCGKGDDPLKVIRVGFGSTCCKQLFFNKILGKVRITEVVEIELGFMLGEDGKTKQGYIDSEPLNWDNMNLAKADGFKSVEEMFAYFDKNYDLSEPRKFWVYKYGWLS